MHINTVAHHIWHNILWHYRTEQIQALYVPLENLAITNYLEFWLFSIMLCSFCLVCPAPAVTGNPSIDLLSQGLRICELARSGRAMALNWPSLGWEPQDFLQTQVAGNLTWHQSESPGLCFDMTGIQGCPLHPDNLHYASLWLTGQRQALRRGAAVQREQMKSTAPQFP